MPNQLIRFSLVGVVGFVADAGTLAIYLAPAPGQFDGVRLISYLVAATAMLILIARFTFRSAVNAKTFRQ